MPGLIAAGDAYKGLTMRGLTQVFQIMLLGSLLG